MTREAAREDWERAGGREGRLGERERAREMVY